MGVSTIDGTLEEAVLKRVRRNLRVYERLTFRLHDGTAKSIAKAVVDGPVAEKLLPGTSGRFYLYTAIDHRGVHGIRDSSGQATFAYPMNNEKAMLVVIPMMVVMIALLLMIDKIQGLAVIVLLISIPGYFFYRNTRIQATKQFQGDTGYSAGAAGAGLAPEPAVSS